MSSTKNNIMFGLLNGLSLCFLESFLHENMIKEVNRIDKNVRMFKLI